VIHTEKAWSIGGLIHPLQLDHQVRFCVIIMKKGTIAIRLGVWAHTIGLTDDIPLANDIEIRLVAALVRFRTPARHITQIESESVCFAFNDHFRVNDLVHNCPARDRIMGQIFGLIFKSAQAKERVDERAMKRRISVFIGRYHTTIVDMSSGPCKNFRGDRARICEVFEEIETRLLPLPPAFSISLHNWRS
jgi:hypothetical protein